MSLSRLELLPTELRLHIYSYLNIPLTNNLRLICARNCLSSDASHSHSQTIIRLTGIYLPNAHHKTAQPILSVEGVEADLSKICGGAGCGMRSLKKDTWCVMATGLMGVNRRIHEEICGILYRKLEVRIGYQLSDVAIHVSETGQLGRMALSSSTLTYLTHLTLAPVVGLHTTSPTPKLTPSFAGTVLKRQTSSLAYIASHCPSLQVLTYSPHPIVLSKVRYTHLAPVVDALVEIAMKSTQLRRLVIQAYQVRPRCGCYGEMRQYNLDGHDPRREALLQEELGWEEGDRVEQEVVRVWAKEVLVGVKKCEELIMGCPNEGSNRQAVSLLGGRYAR
ncbi:hypothetical protein FB567DRAFT_39646 [Paraphoma chrysanthemicola]|uniref:Uncharacterized protein n=1 Tax=Paraphoma chrysanthemicola TaxID=798071 RepID=A0A8K0RJ65_9PLEO|nr:hypothetical protein FB567DRAFT_39646 [Paraphoma chrysanthemicola]